jgi:hypothetical protein
MPVKVKAPPVQPLHVKADLEKQNEYMNTKKERLTRNRSFLLLTSEHRWSYNYYICIKTERNHKVNG